MGPSGEKFYEEGDAEEILKMAMARSPSAGAISRDKLLQTAEELGITPEALAEAEAKFEKKKYEQLEFQEFIGQMRRSFTSHVIAYVIINAFLFAINMITAPGDWWFYWPLLGWGLGLAFHAAVTFSRGSEMQHEAFRDWKRQRTVRRVSEDMQVSGDELERLIEDYVEATKQELRQPNKVEAIAQLSSKTGIDSLDAREVVELYVDRHPDQFK